MQSFVQSPFTQNFLHFSAELLEFAGVGIILVGFVLSTLYFLYIWAQKKEFQVCFSEYRMNIGRGILLGLEILVAADIVGTVLVEPSLKNVGVLGLIVIIRTFLSYSLEVEIHGRWPWQARSKKQ